MPFPPLFPAIYTLLYNTRTRVRARGESLLPESRVIYAGFTNNCYRNHARFSPTLRTLSEKITNKSGDKYAQIRRNLRVILVAAF